ncbi:hypothetical protein UMM65_15850 [Aureibaculum sp. 2210JD6-5]|uniref:hypothetical protein n=1 Tax=Aureibaculum sp. 2210JD6-5 TaxID=3103957 RepID=UPI002AACFD70|nr:hypothetical protein [Aureibaculum sp. 2210JD6-5]MDY7396722.1 hypothetical protein [Aureibaculum sp. 2210JD6-5]
MIKKIAVVSLVIVLCLFMSCNKEKGMDAKVYYNVVNLTDKIDDNIINTFEFEIDTLTIQSSIETSYVGNLLLFNDTLFFADEFFGYLFRFTTEGGVNR